MKKKIEIHLKETPGTVLNAVDGENHQFIDILIENEQKMVISEYVVQVEELSIVVSVKISRKIRVFRFEFLFLSGLPPADLGGSDELANLENGWCLLHLCPHTSGEYNITQSQTFGLP